MEIRREGFPQRYIKKNKLNAGRIIKPDATLKKVLPVASSPRFLCLNAESPRSKRAVLAILSSEVVGFDCGFSLACRDDSARVS